MYRPRTLVFYIRHTFDYGSHYYIMANGKSWTLHPYSEVCYKCSFVLFSANAHRKCLIKKKTPKTYLLVIHSETEPLQSVFLYREPGWTVSSCPIAECSGHWPSRSEEWTRGQELDWGTTSDCSTALEDLHSTDTQTDEVWAETETVRANSRCATEMWLCFHQGAQAAFKLFGLRVIISD